jgi:hypothetical protein
MQFGQEFAHWDNMKVVICRKFMERTGIDPVTSGLQSSTRPPGLSRHSRGFPARAGPSSGAVRGSAGAVGAFRRPPAGYVRDEGIV